MWFDAQAALAKMGGDDAPPARYNPPKPHVAAVAGIAEIAGCTVQKPEKTPSAVRPASPHGASIGGRPLTYTGRVVSLDAWRSLSGWEKHGPRGRLWDGRSKQWTET